MKIVSQKQAAFLGMIAGGRLKKKGGPSKAKAAQMMAENRGMKLRDLPERAPGRKPASRVSKRGGR